MLFPILLLLLMATLIPAQSIYIDLVPAYTSLACCAQSPLSTIVRGMSQGCGDDNKLTSYACFCTSSSSAFSSKISILASKACNNQTQALQAVDVFASYCAIGASGTQAYMPKTTSGTTCTTSSNTTTSARPSGSYATGATATAPPAASSSAISGAAELGGGVRLELLMWCFGILATLIGSEWV